MSSIIDFRPFSLDKKMLTEDYEAKVIYNENDVEVVKIMLETSLKDTISLFARKERDGFKFFIIDEDEFDYELNPDFFCVIPTQGELFKLLTTAKVKDEDSPFEKHLFKVNQLKEVSDLKAFINIQSSYCPNLNLLTTNYFF